MLQEIEFSASDKSDAPDIDREDVCKMLPKRSTKILKTEVKNGLKYVTLHTNCTTREDIKSWISEYEDNTGATYSITKTRHCSGKYVLFKQFLNCHHKTRPRPTNVTTVTDGRNKGKSSTRNTNCPAAIIVTLRAYKNLKKIKDIKEKAKLPCIFNLVLNHNHNTNASALKHRKVSDETREELIKLFKSGHSPATALKMIKTDIYLNDNFENILADRKYCPDYGFCHRLYTKIFKQEYKPLDFTDPVSRKFLQDRLDEYNNSVNDVCCKMISDNSDYIICICPPLFKRIHKYFQFSFEMIFMESTRTLGKKGSRIFVILTHEDCGGLPLGIIITPTESSKLIQMGLGLLIEIAGKDAFGGRIEGPAIIMTHDSTAEQAAVKTVWPTSKTLLCIHHVLQAVKRWLMEAKNNIPEYWQNLYFKDFRTVMYTETVEECLKIYEFAKTKIEHENYSIYLETYWKRRDLWALSYRNNLLTRSCNANNLSETVMAILQDKIVSRMKSFNLVQLIDFMLSKFVNYYKFRLLDAAHNRLRNNLFDDTNKLPLPNVLEQIQVVSDAQIYVPSETTTNLWYIVDINALSCTCITGITETMCKHVHWSAAVVISNIYNSAGTNTNKRKLFYFIANGYFPPANWLLPTLNILNGSKSTDADHLYATICAEEQAFDLNSANNDLQLDVKDGVDNTVQSEEEQSRYGFKIIDDIAQTLRLHLMQAPEQMAPALKMMYNNLKKVPSSASVVTACNTFASGKYNNQTTMSISSFTRYRYFNIHFCMNGQETKDVCQSGSTNIENSRFSPVEKNPCPF